MTTDKPRRTGKIVHVNKAKGYGFISSLDVKFTRIFFYWTALVPQTIKFMELEKGMEVEFELVEDEIKGAKAIKIDVFEADKSEEKKSENPPQETLKEM